MVSRLESPSDGSCICRPREVCSQLLTLGKSVRKLRCTGGRTAGPEVDAYFGRRDILWSHAVSVKRLLAGAHHGAFEIPSRGLPRPGSGGEGILILFLTQREQPTPGRRLCLSDELGNL